MITQKELKQTVNYEPETGLFTWLNRKPRIVGNVKVDGCTSYRFIQVNKQSYAAHRLAFLYMTGKWPDVTDHIDHDGLNNRWDNLRSVTHKENLNNRRPSKKTKSGVPGVYWNKSSEKWVVIIYKCKKLKYLGTFNVLSNAIEVRENAET